MMKCLFFLILSLASSKAFSADFQILDAQVLARAPQERRNALLHFAISSNEDGTPVIYDKREGYIQTLIRIHREFLTAYYPNPDGEINWQKAIEDHATFLAGLYYPSAALGCSGYDALVQKFEIRFYEEQLVLMAQNVAERFRESDIVVSHGPPQTFPQWKQAWDAAAQAKDAEFLLHSKD